MEQAIRDMVYENLQTSSLSESVQQHKYRQEICGTQTGILSLDGRSNQDEWRLSSQNHLYWWVDTPPHCSTMSHTTLTQTQLLAWKKNSISLHQSMICKHEYNLWYFIYSVGLWNANTLEINLKNIFNLLQIIWNEPNLVLKWNILTMNLVRSINGIFFVLRYVLSFRTLSPLPFVQRLIYRSTYAHDASVNRISTEFLRSHHCH